MKIVPIYCSYLESAGTFGHNLGNLKNLVENSFSLLMTWCKWPKFNYSSSTFLGTFCKCVPIIIEVFFLTHAKFSSLSSSLSLIRLIQVSIDAGIHNACTHEACAKIHDEYIHDVNIHDACIHDSIIAYMHTYIFDPGSWCLYVLCDCLIYACKHDA